MKNGAPAESSARGLAVEDAPAVISYPRQLPADPKKAFLEIHQFLTDELLQDLEDNVSYRAEIRNMLDA